MPPKTKAKAKVDVRNWRVPKDVQAKRDHTASRILMREDSERRQRGVKTRNTEKILALTDQHSSHRSPVTDQRFRSMFRKNMPIWDAEAYDKSKAGRKYAALARVKKQTRNK